MMKWILELPGRCGFYGNRALVFWLINAFIGAMFALVIYGALFAERPKDWHYDMATGVSTWTDKSGRKLMKPPDGSVREISQ